MSSNLFQSLVKGLKTVISDKVTTRALNKEDVQALIRDNIDGHKKIIYALESGTDAELVAWFRDKIRPVIKSSKNKAAGSYDQFVSKLGPKAKNLEQSRPFGSLLQANRDFAGILSEINKKIDTVMEEEAVTLFQTRMTSFALLGLLRKSDDLLNYSIFMFTLYSRMSSGTEGNIPKYREAFLTNKTNIVAATTTSICAKDGPFLFLKDMDNIRKRQGDLIMNVNSTSNFADHAVARLYPSSFMENIMTALSCLNFFDAALDTWEQYKLNKHEKNKELKEWLENHVALLRMDLRDLDKDSPEYLRQLDLIKAYDSKISEYDEKINSFEKE